MKKFIAIFFVILLAIGANLSDGFLARYGVEPNLMWIAGGALVVSLLIADERIGFIVLVCLVAIAANLPDEMAQRIGYDPELMLALLVGLVLIPILSRHL